MLGAVATECLFVMKRLVAMESQVVVVLDCTDFESSMTRKNTDLNLLYRPRNRRKAPIIDFNCTTVNSFN